MCGLLKADFVCVVGSVGAGGGAVRVCVLRNLSHTIFVSVAESVVATLKATYENSGVCACVSLCMLLNLHGDIQ